MVGSAFLLAVAALADAGATLTSASAAITDIQAAVLVRQRCGFLRRARVRLHEPGEPQRPDPEACGSEAAQEIATGWNTGHGTGQRRKAILVHDLSPLRFGTIPAGARHSSPSHAGHDGQRR
jgi:hypothetical protein